MADIRAILNNSNFNLPATWSGNVVPGAGDIAFANGNTVLVSDTRQVLAISNASGTGGIVVGGTFSLQGGCNLTTTNPNGIVQGVTGTPVVTVSDLSVGQTATIAGVLFSATSTSGGSSGLVNFTSGGTLNFVGDIPPLPMAAQSRGINVAGTGTLNYTGNYTGGSSAFNQGAFNISGNATVNITGTGTGGSGANTANAILITATAATVTVNGPAFGGSTAAAFNNNSSSTLTHNGLARSSSTMPVYAAGSATQNTRASGPFEVGATGNINPVQAQSIRRAPSLVPTYFQIPQANGSTMTELSSGDRPGGGNYPVTSSVDLGVVYGRNNEFTGTSAKPPQSSVAQGVPVGAGTGTAILTGANVLAALGMVTGNLDAQLAEKASFDQVADIVQGAARA
jgi:hypothetical protein